MPILSWVFGHGGLHCSSCSLRHCSSPRTILSTLNRIQVLLSWRTIETGLTLRVICGSYKRLPASDPSGFEEKEALTPVKDRSRNLPVSRCAEVLNRQGMSLENRGIRR